MAFGFLIVAISPIDKPSMLLGILVGLVGFTFALDAVVKEHTLDND